MTFLVQQTLLYAIPLMIVALAGVFAERSGIINLALEGIMIFGAFIGVLFVNLMQQAEVLRPQRPPATGLRYRGWSCSPWRRPLFSGLCSHCCSPLRPSILKPIRPSAVRR